MEGGKNTNHNNEEQKQKGNGIIYDKYVICRICYGLCIKLSVRCMLSLSLFPSRSLSILPCLLDYHLWKRFPFLQTVDINYYSHLNYLWSSNTWNIYIYSQYPLKILVLMNLLGKPIDGVSKYINTRTHSNSFNIDDGEGLSLVIHKNCCYTIDFNDDYNIL